MCATPILIENPTRRFVPGTSKQVFTVPCGKCKECIKKMQDDWFVRSVFETKRVESKGGAVWFPTLTYNPECLPYWNDEENDFRIPCFCKEHFKSFRNKLRIYLKREGYDCKEENTIRYIYCCEFGGKKGRPHLHTLLYVPFHVPSALMKKILDKCWTYGFVMWSKKGMIAQGLRASQYCMKYISKDMNWMSRYDIENYIYRLKSKVQLSENEDEYLINKSKLNAFRRCMPHHCQSMGFGIDGLNYFKDNTDNWDIKKCMEGSLDSCQLGLPPTKAGMAFKYNMPTYYMRKIFYYIDEYNTLRLNDFGIEMLKYRYELSLRRESDKYRLYTQSISVLKSHLSPLELSDEDIQKIFDITSNLCGHEKSLAIYNKVYRDVLLTPDRRNYLENLDSQKQLSILNEYALDFMLDQKTVDCIPVERKTDVRKNFDVNDTYASLECYTDFNSTLLYIENLENQIGELITLAYYQQREIESNLFGKEEVYTLTPLTI